MGKDSNLVLDSQRRLARGILVALATSMVLFVLFASGPNLGFSIAGQQTTTPPPSPSESQSPGAFRIEFINPSGSGHSEVVSDKNDGTDSAYHLVAWVNQLPANASVEFRYRDPKTNQEVTIGNGTQTGIPDTFDLKWEVPDTLPESDDPRNNASATQPFQLTLIAVLFSGTQEVDRDTESDIFLNQRDPDPDDPLDVSENAADTVEITAPANGGAWGLFTPRDRATAGVLRVSLSADATSVRAVYTVTPAGQEPIWTTCGTESKTQAADGVKCTLSSQHKGSQVTAVGAIADSNESGDAHRVQAYEQVPNALTLDQSTQDNVNPGTCSRVFTATLVDQFQIPITNANMDVHARGPVDDIAFDNGTTASPNKAPDRGGHNTEAARRCSANPPAVAGSQGDHESPTGSDTKHIESAATAGTSDSGQWTFQLFSPQAGITEFVVWSDVDDDDAFCSTEASASGSIGWGQAAGSSALTPEVTSCPSPSPSSPAPGPSTPGPTPTGTQSPDPRGCTVTGTEGSETLEGTPEDDVICAYGGDDIITGGDGNDVIYGDEGRDDIRGGAGSDEIHAGADNDTARGNPGQDEIYGNGDNDALRGSLGDDRVIGGGGTDAVRGGAGRDTVTGGGGPDDLTGGSQNDVLRGGPENDSLVGGSGRDRCRGDGGRDGFRGCETKRQ